MNKIITSIALMLAAAISNAQTTATNWTATDCNSVSHTLFNKLDSGKVIVFIWVMPCGACVPGAKAAYNAAQSFATSHPGKVLFYLADDLGDATCTSLTSWVTSNSIGATANMTIFSNSGNVIDEADFGGTGMPHVIVMAGTDHQIYYNKKNSATNDQPGITAAVNSALTALNVATLSTPVSFSVTPNPASDMLDISHSRPIQTVTITTLAGQVMTNETFAAGKANPTVSIKSLAAGIYLIKMTDADGRTATEKIVKQ